MKWLMAIPVWSTPRDSLNRFNLVFSRCPYEESPLRLSLFRLSKNLPGYKYRREGYHRLARANTPDSVSFRRFLLFSPWRAPARLRLKNQKSLENTSLAGAEQKCVQTRKGPQRILAVLSRGLTQYGRISARQNRICPCQAMVPLFLCSYYGRRSGGIQMCEQHPKGPAAKWAQQERWGERPNRAFCPSAYLYKRVLCYISS